MYLDGQFHRIKKALSSKTTELNWSNKNIDCIISSIGRLTQLKRLDLSLNKLAEIPAEIGNLENLEELNLSHNNLSTLPPEIAKLKKLRKLNLSYNKFYNSSGLPQCIFTLYNLTDLTLNGNRLSLLPKRIGQLANLEGLGLYDNKLTEIPPEIEQLGKLKRLAIAHNNLTSIPCEIGHLRNLVYLGLNENHLLSLPKEIGNLTNLKELNLNKDHLFSLPKEIGKLTNLEKLDLGFNSLLSIPDEIESLFNLNKLSLQANSLISLPSGIGNLTNLKSLILNSNKITSLPVSLSKLASLEELQLYGNPLKNPPVDIANAGKKFIFNYLRKLDSSEDEIVVPTHQEVAKNVTDNRNPKVYEIVEKLNSFKDLLLYRETTFLKRTLSGLKSIGGTFCSYLRMDHAGIDNNVLRFHRWQQKDIVRRHNKPTEYEITRIDSFKWFDPDPIKMSSQEIEEHIQYRKMTPMELMLSKPDSDELERIQFYIIPESVRKASLTGEDVQPWCYDCNETFFWDPNVKGTFMFSDGCGFKCSKCMRGILSWNISLDRNGKLLEPHQITVFHQNGADNIHETIIDRFTLDLYFDQSKHFRDPLRIEAIDISDFEENMADNISLAVINTDKPSSITVKLLSLKPDLPIIVLGNKDNYKKMVSNIQFLPKPFEIEELFVIMAEKLLSRPCHHIPIL